MYAVKVCMGLEEGMTWLTETHLNSSEISNFNTYGTAKSHGEVWKGGYSIWKWNIQKNDYEVSDGQT